MLTVEELKMFKITLKTVFINTKQKTCVTSDIKTKLCHDDKKERVSETLVLFQGFINIES